MKKRKFTKNDEKITSSQKMSLKSSSYFSKEGLKKFWHYLWHDDSFGSYVLNLALAFIVIKFMFFPAIGFVLNNDYPIVAIVSGSMEHKIVSHHICNIEVVDVTNKRLSHDEWWEFCGKYYEDNFNLTKDKFANFEYKNGLNIGDVMVLYGKDPAKIEVGEVLVFVPQDRNFFATRGPVIHRVIRKWTDENGNIHFQTKGDHNPQSFDNFENDIPEKDVIGVSIARVPFIGYAKIAMSNVATNIMRYIR